MYNLYCRLAYSALKQHLQLTKIWIKSTCQHINVQQVFAYIQTSSRARRCEKKRCFIYIDYMQILEATTTWNALPACIETYFLGFMYVIFMMCLRRVYDIFQTNISWIIQILSISLKIQIWYLFLPRYDAEINTISYQC